MMEFAFGFEFCASFDDLVFEFFCSLGAIVEGGHSESQI
jgi:hypothetical protein